MIIHVTGRFHVAFGFTYALSAYLAAQVGQSWGLPFAASAAFGAVVGAALGVLMERFIYGPLDQRMGDRSLLPIFVSSLGLSTLGGGVIGLVWLTQVDLNITNFTLVPMHVGRIFFTNRDLIATIVGWVAIVGLWTVMKWTRLGRMIRAVRVNPSMSLAVGIDPKMVFMAVFAIGSVLGGLSAVFDAAYSQASPDMGDNILLYAIVIAFLSGPSASPLRVAAVGVFMGMVQTFSIFVVSANWAPVIIFGFLMAFVVLRPAYERIPGLLARRRSMIRPEALFARPPDGGALDE
jgi:branched-chain amino acid transport system permease protein